MPKVKDSEIKQFLLWHGSTQFVKTGCFFDFTFIMFDVLINEGLRF